MGNNPNAIRNQSTIPLIILAVLVLLVAVGAEAFYLATQSKNPHTSSTSDKGTVSKSITLTSYNLSNPTIIQLTYPKERVNVGGQSYKATQIIISAQLYIPEENDYSIFSSFDSLGSITSIDGKEGASFESVFHLTPGYHNVEIKYINDVCMDREYLEKKYGSEVKERNIYFAIRKKSEKQTIKNFTMFDNPLEIRTESKPFKKSGIYLHCL